MPKKVAKSHAKTVASSKVKRSPAKVAKPSTVTTKPAGIQLHRYVGIAVAIAVVGVLLSGFFNWKLQQIGFELQQTAEASQNFN